MFTKTDYKRRAYKVGIKRKGDKVGIVCVVSSKMEVVSEDLGVLGSLTLVTVLGLCVCLSTTILALQATKRHQSDSNSSSATSARKINKRFF